MGYRFTKVRKIAIVLLLVFIFNTLAPSVALALTSGPVQPEAQGFQPAGVSDMVDLETGDFKYNIPLLDIDGYPINLNYASGTGMDDEASWVGLGWSLNPGAINRQVRGVPDDLAGDEVETYHYTKPKITVGTRISAKAELFGNGSSDSSKKGPGHPISFNGTLSLGIFSDNYTGIGADVSANAGISISMANDGPLTTSLGLGITSGTASGVDVSPNISMSLSEKAKHDQTVKAGLNASLGYNTRSGMKDLTLGSSFNYSKVKKEVDDKGKVTSEYETTGANLNAGGSFISFNTEPITPKIEIPYTTQYDSFSFDGGGNVGPFFLGGGYTGYRSIRAVAAPAHRNPEYGFLYAERGKDNPRAVMDFIREKENPIIPELPNLALPVSTPDLFTYTSQGGSGQFRLYRGGTGAYFDNTAGDTTTQHTLGFDAGFGAYAHGGVTLFKQETRSTTRKWTGDNDYLTKGDFQDASLTNPSAQHVYFKQVGEKTLEDSDMVFSKLHGTQPIAISIAGKTANAALLTNGNSFLSNVSDTIQKRHRQINRTVITYQTAKEASKAGFDRRISYYPFNNYSTSTPFSPPANHRPVADSLVARDSGYRKPHHISEITVTDDGGKRMVYGMPVYNLTQQEYSYAIGSNYTLNSNSLVSAAAIGAAPRNSSYQFNNSIDNYYHRETQPAYASSFLLTEILSPDYVDKTGDGVTDDDLGTAIKFNYSKIEKFCWRTPFSQATLNKCMLADALDDKASVVYGEKELCYISSIETKTKVAYFITQDRADALGVNASGVRISGVHQKCLREIRLYSKADRSKPIKVVKFEYSYELCPGVPNSTAGGKLTLKKVWFEYGNVDKGKYHPYQFAYNTSNGQNVHYKDMSTDRWGIYKPNPAGSTLLKNDEFPYTGQANRDTISKYAASWHLDQITLPTGGVIRVTYESDDYAYVQNKRAMIMQRAPQLIDSGGTVIDSTHLSSAQGLAFHIDSVPPAGTTDYTDWFKRKYLNGSDYLYTKLYVKVSTDLSESGGKDYDFVPCYAQVSSATISGNTAKVFFANATDENVSANPIIMAAWQRMKNEYPRYAYPGFDTRTKDGDGKTDIIKALLAVFHAIGNLDELRENFYDKARSRGYASTVNLGKSFIRLTKADGFKLGGGIRVQKIQISDDWATMSGNSAASAGAYGQAYSYTTTEDGQTISSGVAAYEPAVGSDENPLKQPVPYVEHINGALDNFYQLEEPFGESFFPAPSVVYSKVTVRDLNKDGSVDANPKTGFIVDEFYTAKDFPVQVHVLPMQKNENKPANFLSFIGGVSVDEMCMSQGYSIELNDMHGKQKATRVLNQAGAEISSTAYYYNAENSSAGEMRLKNKVDIIRSNGRLDTARVIGRDIEFFTDFREDETRNRGQSIGFGGDLTPLAIIPLFIPHWPLADNNEDKLFRSACAVKVSTYYGIVDKVIKTENGSSITTQNIAYDGLTGEPLVTRTQNEFDKDIYSVNLPAYWAYDGMGLACQNLGVVMKDFSTNSNGEVLGSYSNYLHAGDEIANINNTVTGTRRYWVIDNAAIGTSGNSKKLIDSAGNIKVLAPAMVKIVRSGYRNILSAGTASVVCLNNPIQNNVLRLTLNTDLTALKVINASATTYDEYWGQPLLRCLNPPTSGYGGDGVPPPDTNNYVLNPYVEGFLGNWRLYQSMVYQQSRKYNDVFNPANNAVDVKNAGYINSFYAYWYYGATGKWIVNTAATRWTIANTVTLYDKYGQQLENKDALGRYSAAKFDFNGELPSAVASNAMSKEIYANGFEDTKFAPGTVASTGTSSCPEEFIGSGGLTIKQMVDSSVSHTGNYSILLPSGGMGLISKIHNQTQKVAAYLGFDGSMQYITRNAIDGLYPHGFEPGTGKAYIFNAWVKDGLPMDTATHISVTINGSPVTLTRKATVEGWKLVEGTFTLGSFMLSTPFTMQVSPTTSNVHIDDIRMHPFNSHLKTYAYNDKNMRLMAEIDENGFATFYEYDEEGLLVRVKKETERGIMTLKESRSSYRKTL
ncbi:hypothetical protein BEL04_18885 [Mucilaginibacter sp. PPCGB 2223]|uniref:hypothetical protein n=1 Tax=Mucilaginibacter sp. PPCGB 2223 TaxID=1886027 RepID=UPI00082408AE|nr:hypothetical protein [Mucilaginibacter sp. PPCGB 2223]OCX50797.1 hypothetical protein BEL04_18885 [Mucilaginibacter sp. PPCGB 2223]